MSYAEDYDYGYSGNDFCRDDIKFDDLTWITKDGTEILICRLEDDHLVNIVRMLRDKGKTVPYHMELELVRRDLDYMLATGGFEG